MIEADKKQKTPLYYERIDNLIGSIHKCVETGNTEIYYPLLDQLYFLVRFDFSKEQKKRLDKLIENRKEESISLFFQLNLFEEMNKIGIFSFLKRNMEDLDL